jgi:RNA polymerase sigma-70 factor (ECF subfamily)
MVTGEDISACTDGELAARVAGSPDGDQAAEAALCARLGPRVRAYGLRHLGSESAADDLVQRVLLLMVEKLRQGEVREPARIVSFVLGSARLCSRDIRRRGARLESLETNDRVTETLNVPAPEPIDRERLAARLAALPERERSVLVMTYFEEATAAEIGAALGIDPGHVRVVRHRALTRLRQTLMPPGEEHP